MLSVVRTFLEAACQALQIDRGAMHAVVLAGGEAVINIIRHAHRDKPEAQIQLQMHVTSDSIVLDFEDEGDPFDLEAVPQLDPGELRLGGRGVYMMRALMDQVSCQPRSSAAISCGWSSTGPPTSGTSQVAAQSIQSVNFIILIAPPIFPADRARQMISMSLRRRSIKNSRMRGLSTS